MTARSMPSATRGAVHEALDREHTLRLAGAAHRRHRDLVGECELDVEPERRHLIAERQRRSRSVRHVDAARRIGAVLVDQRAANAADFAAGVERHLHVPDLVALLGGGDEVLAAVLDPFHRPAQEQRGERNHRLLLVEHELRSEAAADIRRHDPHAVLVAPQELGEHAHADVRRLCRAEHRQPVFVLIVVRHEAAALDRVAAAAIDAKLFPDNMRCTGEGRGNIAVTKCEFANKIVRCAVMDGRRTGRERGLGIDGARQRLVVDHDQSGGILRDLSARRDHGRDRLADMHDLARCQHRPMDLLTKGG